MFFNFPVSTVDAYSDVFEKSENSDNSNNDRASEIQKLREEWQLAQDRQGIFGKALDFVKNKVPFLSKFGMKGSEEIEKIIQQAENCEIYVEEARKATEKYTKNQDKVKEAAFDAGTAIAAKLLVVWQAVLWAGELVR